MDPARARESMKNWQSTSSIDKLKDLGGLVQQEFLEYSQRIQEDHPLNISCLAAVRQLQHKGKFEDAFVSLEQAVDAEEGRREKALASMLLAEHINRWCAACTGYNTKLMAKAAQYAHQALLLFESSDGPSTPASCDSTQDIEDLDYKRAACYWKVLNFATLASLGGCESYNARTAMQESESALGFMRGKYRVLPEGNGGMSEQGAKGQCRDHRIREGREHFADGIINHCKAVCTEKDIEKYGDVRELRDTALIDFKKSYEVYFEVFGNDRNDSVKAMTMISVMYKLLGRLEEALEWLEKETACRARLFGRANQRTQLAFKKLEELKDELGLSQRGGSVAILEESFQLDPRAVPPESISWEINPFEQSEQFLLESILAMFHALNLPKTFDIPHSNLTEFLLAVREGYHDNPFHNWKHAWSVTHCSFMLLSTTAASQILTPLEQLSVLITCLCHDLDHPGVNSDFLIKSASPLAVTFDIPNVLEHMHFQRTKDLLRPGYSTNLLENCDGETRKMALECIFDGIMATDMQNHKSIVNELGARAEAGKTGGALAAYNKEDAEDRRQLLRGIVHASDLSAQGFSTDIAYAFGARVLEEFHKQSCQEERESLPQTAFMKDLDTPLNQAKAQLGFLHYVVGPLWKNVGGLFPETRHLQENIDARAQEIDFDNLHLWKGHASSILSNPWPQVSDAESTE